MIYFDHAATTGTYPEVLLEMTPFFRELYGNPSSIYEFGKAAKEMMERARKQIARSIGAKKEEIYFTSGGTEADNWAILKTAEKNREKGKHIITSGIEHHAVLRTCAFLERNGYEVTYLPVDENGLISVSELEQAIREDTILITIMYANNEIGTVQPVREIGELAGKKGILFHTDAVQAYLHEKIDVEKEHIDMLSASGHKFGGPKGVGFLYIREGTELPSLLRGGDQEKKRRAGTENVAGIVGMGKASAIGEKNFEENHETLLRMRNTLIERLQTEIPDSRINGSLEKRLDGNVNVIFKVVEGEALLLLLDMAGICVSSGSACNSSSKSTSHVLQAIGVPPEYIRGTIRITLGAENTMEEIDTLMENLKGYVQNLRENA
ncbi:MAG: cysteine desulfurase [Lachnospiraceae bacterium]|nr:cysteine desulfurase [Lachnospiraceae bacterium]